MQVPSLKVLVKYKKGIYKIILLFDATEDKDSGNGNGVSPNEVRTASILP